MEERDPAGLVRRFKQALEHMDETGSLRPSDLQLPIYASPQYYKQPLQGYDGGAFDPERLGAACLVVPPAEGRGAYTPCTWNLKVPPPLPSFPDRPSALQHLALVEPALFRA